MKRILSSQLWDRGIFGAREMRLANEGVRK